MRKKTIALAIASVLCGTAFAQSNVTIYGVADAYWNYAKSDNQKRTGIDQGGLDDSHIGFRGEESLGNGLKAIFTVEFGYDIDDNSGLASTRQSFVGLDTSIGALTIGRQYAPSYMYMTRNSANEVTLNQPLNMMLDDVVGEFLGGTMTAGDDSRWNNSIAYQSKNWSGFETRIVYGFGEHTETNAPGSPDVMDDGRFGISGSYENGPFNIDLIYQARFNVPDATTGLKTGDDVNEWLIGGAYDFDVAKVFATYQYGKNDNGGDDAKIRLWALGVAVPVSDAGTVSFEYGEGRYKLDSRATDGRSRGFGLAYTHELSKRTTIYAGVGFMKNKDRNGAGSSLALGFNGVGEAGESNWSVATGISHAF